MDLAAAMLEEDPQRAASENELGKQPLQYAVYYNQPEALELLKAAGADLNAADGTGMTALHVAARFGRKATLWLLANGADLHQPDVFGDLPSHTAAIYGQQRVIKALHQAGDPLTTVNKAGLTPAALARKYRQGETAAFIESLLETGG
jgi:ankyrin repeat protein